MPNTNGLMVHVLYILCARIAHYRIFNVIYNHARTHTRRRDLMSKFREELMIFEKVCRRERYEHWDSNDV